MSSEYCFNFRHITYLLQTSSTFSQIYRFFTHISIIRIEISVSFDNTNHTSNDIKEQANINAHYE